MIFLNSPGFVEGGPRCHNNYSLSVVFEEGFRASLGQAQDCCRAMPYMSRKSVVFAG